MPLKKNSKVKAYEQTVIPESDGFPGGAHPRENAGLIGHEQAVERFIESYARGAAAKGYLITGARGIGKATLTYALIRGIMRAEREKRLLTKEDVYSSEQDDIYRKIAVLSHPNLKILRREYNFDRDKFYSGVTIDNVRGLKKFFSLKAHGEGARFCVIDAAEDMSHGANAVPNALLKTLEEPPPNTYFFLISHREGALLPTIRSRCVRIPLAPLPENELKQALKTQPLFAHIPEDRLAKITAAAKGSVRNAAIYADDAWLGLASAVKSLLHKGGEAGAMLERVNLKRNLTESGADMTEKFDILRTVLLNATADTARFYALHHPERGQALFLLGSFFKTVGNLLKDAEDYNFSAYDIADCLTSVINAYISERIKGYARR